MESTAMKDDLERVDKSCFSFTTASTFKDYSTVALFSDDNENDTTSDADDNSFIEIALDHPEFEQRKLDQLDPDLLRISFSSSFPSNITEIQPNIVEDYVEPASSSSLSSSSLRLSASTFRSSSTGTSTVPVLGSESFTLYESSRRRDHLPPFNPLVHTLLFSLETPPPLQAAAEAVGENGGDDHNLEYSHMQLAMINADHNHRKSSNITTAATTTSGGKQNNGIMKLLMIKFRATKVRKILTSFFAKPRGQLNYFSSNKANDRSSYRKRLRQYYCKETLEHHDPCDHEGMNNFGNDNVSIMNDVKSTCDPDDCRAGYKSRVLDVNLGAVRGVLEACNMSKRGRSKRKTSSCPSSIKCSPIHQGFAGNVSTICAGENSIQAAIAHCKSSLGQSSDFRF